jgi:hypothetical protein
MAGLPSRLRRAGLKGKVSLAMSAQEVIEQIKAMPPEDREEVANYVRELEAISPTPEQNEPDWDRIIEEVFDEHEELFRKLAQ